MKLMFACAFFLFPLLSVAQDFFLDISGDQVFPAGEQKTLSASNNTLTYTWDLGDGTMAQGTDVIHTYSAPGRYLVRVTGTEGENSATQYYWLFANPDTVPQDQWYAHIYGTIDSPSFPQLIQSGSTTRFEASANVEGARFFWSIQGTDISAEGAAWDFTAPTWDGLYTAVEMWAQHPDGTYTPFGEEGLIYGYDSIRPPITDLAGPDPDEDGVFRININETLSLTANGDAPTERLPLDYFWQIVGREAITGFGCNQDGTDDEGTFGQLYAFQQSEPGRYCIKVTAIDNGGVSDPYGRLITVVVKGENQPPQGFINSPSAVINVGESYQLVSRYQDLEDDIVSYRWELGNGQTSEARNPTVSYSQPGVYRVSLTVIDSAGDEDPTPYQRLILVNDPQAVPINSVPEPSIHNPDDDDFFGLDQDIPFRGFINDADDEGVTAFWDFDNGTPVELPGRAFDDDGNPMPLQALARFDFPGVYEAQLLARDAKGFAKGGATKLFYVYEELEPPRSEIKSANLMRDSLNDEGRLYGVVGETITFEAAATGGAGDYEYTWNIYSLWPPYPETYGPTRTVTFEEPGAFGLQLEVRDGAGIWDPLPDYAVIVILENRPPENVAMLEPSDDVNIGIGDNISLAAADAVDPDGDPLTYIWHLSDGRRLEGRRVDYVTFENPGVYNVTLSVTDDQGQEVFAPTTEYITVNQTALDGENLPPDVCTVSPMPLVTGPIGTSITFTAEATDPYEKEIIGWIWDFGNGDISEEAGSATTTFEEEGYYTVRVWAKNSDFIYTQWPAEWNVTITGDNIPPESTILEPALRDRADFEKARTIPVLLGEPLTLRGTASDRDGNYPLNLSWQIDYQDVAQGEQPSPLTFNERRDYRLHLDTRDSKNERDPIPDYRTIRVVDPNLKPESTITEPDGEITVAPGDTLNFRGFGVDPNNLEMTLQWTLSDGRTYTGVAVENVLFQEEGEYSLSMKAVTEFTEDPTPQEVRIIVRAITDEDLEPNDTFAEAPVLGRGNYRNLSLGEEDPADTFLFNLDQESRDLKIAVSADAALTFQLYSFPEGSDGAPILLGTRNLTNNSLSFEDLPLGTYGLEIKAVDQAKRRTGLSYNFGVLTLAPELYLPFLVEDGSLTSTFGLINPGKENAQVAIAALDGNGRIVEQISFDLGPHQRLYRSSLDFFGRIENVEQARRIRWLEVSSTRRLVGYTNAATQDEGQLMSAGAVRGLTDEIFLPHIAQDTNTWFTRAVVINGDDAQQTVNFDFLGNVSPIAEMAPGKQEDFRIAERFENLPAWGRFSNEAGQAVLAGYEIFGKADGTSQMAGLEMLRGPRNNPNLTTLSGELIFTHVALDEASFWTGVVLVNTQDFEMGYNIVGYNNDGDEIRLDGLSLPPGGKYVGITAQLFGPNSGVSWMRVEAEQGMLGLELFGDTQGTRLAGFPVATVGTDQLIFPHVVGGEWFTGIAMLNLGVEGVEVTLTAYNDAGEALATAQTEIAAGAKLVRLPDQLFPEGYPDGVTYIVARGNRNTLNGFQLFGDLAQKQFAGLSALIP